MALLLRSINKIGPVSLKNRSGLIGTVTVRYGGYWNKDWKPGPYPKTPEEREAAAKKYGLLPEDYDVYPDDGMGHGDYPKLEPVSNDMRDPYHNYDYPYLRRDWGEPIHVDADMYSEDRISLARQRFTLWEKMRWLFTVIGLFSAAWLLCERYPLTLAVMPKQFPYNELWVENGGDPDEMPKIKHYTFEPAEPAELD